MTQLDKNNLTEKGTAQVGELWQFGNNLLKSIRILRWVGYGLLVLFLFDLVEIFVPSRFMNPVWEFQTMGTLVERAAVPLIAFALVFFGESKSRSQLERPVLKSLSWLALLYGLVMLLLVPLGVVNTLRIDRQNNAQITTQVTQQMTQIKQVKDQMAKATTKEKMQEFLSLLDSQGRVPDIQDSQQLEEVTKNFSSFITQTENSLKSQAETTRSSKRLALLKNSVKWNLGALVSGSLFLLIWRFTSWAR